MKTLNVIGLGVAEQADLSHEALQVIHHADLVIGSARQLLTLSAVIEKQKTVVLPKLKALKACIEMGKNVVVIASGDPLYYGIGRWINAQYPNLKIGFFPAVSSITQACNMLGIAQQDIKVISLHGRPLAKLKVSLKAHQTLLILTDKASQPAHLARICLESGFDDAMITVCERLGYHDQKITTFALFDLLENNPIFDPLHVSFIFCKKNNGYLPEFAGIKDTHFETGELGAKGMISKREVRLAVLSLLQLQKDDCLWDIGAGCGAVSVELAYWQPQATIHAIEHHQARFDCLNENQQKFGVVTNLKPILGRAPEILSTLPMANKIFIGGSDGELAGLLTHLWKMLPAGGQIVISAVMEQTKAQLLSFYNERMRQADCESETLQIAINKGSELAKQLIYRPALPVTLFSFIKKEGIFVFQ